MEERRRRGEPAATKSERPPIGRLAFPGRAKLRGNLFGEGLDAGGGELEADLPFAGGAATGHFGGIEFPAAHGFQSDVGEILARAGIGEIGFGDVAGSVDVGQDADADFAGNRGKGFVGDVGQDLVEHFAMT